eukprot:jgi/Botrbrau1/6905/Bobra.67_3s0024.1
MKSPWSKLGAALYYGLASSAVQMTNKALFTSYLFNFPLIVASMQMLATVIVTYVAARPALHRSAAISVLPLAVINAGNCMFGLIGTAGLNVPMFIALRRFTLIFTIVLDYLLFRKAYDFITISSVSVMVGGALLAAVTDLTYNLKGYLAVFGNDICTALYLVLIRHTKEKASLSTLGMMFYTTGLGLPVVVGALILSKEPAGAAAYVLHGSGAFKGLLAMSLLLGFAVNHATFLCTFYNDPLTTSVMGNIKNIALTIIGAFAFGDFLYKFWNVLGLAVSMLGAIWYSTRLALKERELHRLTMSAQSSGHVDTSKSVSEGGKPRPNSAVELKARASGRAGSVTTNRPDPHSEIRPLLEDD